MKIESGGQGRITRREALRILALGGAAGAAVALGALPRRRGGAVERSRLLMGTGVHLRVLGDDREAAAAAADACLDRMAALEALLSRHRADSELARLHALGRLEDASDALLDVLRLAGRVSALGEGAFDVTVQPVLDLYAGALARTGRVPPPEAIERERARVDWRAVRCEGRSVSLARPDVRLTLDGVAKGYVVDQAVAVLRARGFGSVFVEAGGDLMAAGERAAGAPWRVGIRAPREGLGLVARIDARNRAVATSGDYMQPFTADYREHHILDPRTGHSAPELASATVVADDAATADALATLVMVLGPRRGRELLEDLPGCEGYLVGKDLRVVRTRGLALA
jgi:thiamine biosynthesis lipoprotein